MERCLSAGNRPLSLRKKFCRRCGALNLIRPVKRQFVMKAPQEYGETQHHHRVSRVEGSYAASCLLERQHVCRLVLLSSVFVG